jgi:hypothetical protein
MSSKSYITVDWSRLASTYDSALSSPSADGGWKAPTIGVVWTRFVDFLTANFQRECMSRSKTLPTDERGRKSGWG